MCLSIWRVVLWSLVIVLTGLVDRLLVDIDAEGDEATKNRLPIRALQPLILTYQISWPVNAILNAKCMKFYNEIFRFLLMTKQAKYSVDALRFTGACVLVYTLE